MNYHNILHDDMRNGEGLRVVLFVSGCNHYCKDCHNPETWDCNSGIHFDEIAKEEIFEQLSKDYIDGITLSGGDPLYKENISDIYNLVKDIKEKYSEKTIWIYTGFEFEEIINADPTPENIIRKNIISLCDVIVDGKFKSELSDVNYEWAGSTNQRIWHKGHFGWYTSQDNNIVEIKEEVF